MKPQYSERLSRKIADLTGITDGKLSGAMHFQDAIEEFASWCVDAGEDVEVYAWSESNLCQVKSELKQKKIHASQNLNMLLSRWHDFQAEFDALVGSGLQLFLDHALCISGIPFVGRMHDAQDDARSTMELYRITRDKDSYLKMMNQIREETEHEETHASIGELIDLEALRAAIA